MLWNVCGILLKLTEMGMKQLKSVHLECHSNYFKILIFYYELNYWNQCFRKTICVSWILLKYVQKMEYLFLKWYWIYLFYFLNITTFKKKVKQQNLEKHKAIFEILSYLYWLFKIITLFLILLKILEKYLLVFCIWIDFFTKETVYIKGYTHGS